MATLWIGSKCFPSIPHINILPRLFLSCWIKRAKFSITILITPDQTGSITTPEDAAVISRDNLARDTQEVFTSIVTDKDDEILAVNQHTVGGPNQSQVFPYVSAGQILNVTGAGRAWIVHNHPSGESQLSPSDLRISAVFDDLLKDTGIGRMPINCDHAFLVFLV
ncbi:MAG: JAB domain-containing protein [Syntrophales bacterium]|nr:JAB domain-containing protein [Syntrophales bacterium]MDP3098756.1 JAB domain-containing protein [Syntrophales bacterium]